MSKNIITQYTGKFSIERMKSSRMGNPRYAVLMGGVVIGSTRPNSSLAYGAVPNNAERGVCCITVSKTPSGRRYIDKVEKLS